MKVIALETGYHGGVLRYENDQFDVPEGSKASWYVPAASQQTHPKNSGKGQQQAQQQAQQQGQQPGAGLV